MNKTSIKTSSYDSWYFLYILDLNHKGWAIYLSEMCIMKKEQYLPNSLFLYLLKNKVRSIIGS